MTEKWAICKSEEANRNLTENINFFMIFMKKLYHHHNNYITLLITLLITNLSLEVYKSKEKFSILMSRRSQYENVQTFSENMKMFSNAKMFYL